MLIWWFDFEGETEEQALPLFFQERFSCAGCDSGVCFVGVGGTGGYGPFLRVLEAFTIPWLIFSDGEPMALARVHRALSQIGASAGDGRLVTIPDSKDFEGYLLSQGYEMAIEAGIDEVDGVGFVDRWISNTDGQATKPRRTQETCEKCKQNIWKPNLRDQSVAGGRALALAEILNAGKTKYAAPVAKEILKIEGETRFPPIIRTLMDKIQDKLGA